MRVVISAPPGLYPLLLGLFTLSAAFLRLRVIASRTEISGLLARTGVVMIDETPSQTRPIATHPIRRLHISHGALMS